MTRIAFLTSIFFAVACSPTDDSRTFAVDHDHVDTEPEMEAGPSSDTSTEDEVEVEAEPMPPFWIGMDIPSGGVAIDEEGITTFSVDGAEYYSHLELVLQSSVQAPCVVSVLPHLAELDSPEVAGPSMTFDLGKSLILIDQCGWDDDYMLAEFAALGTITIGLHHDLHASGDALDLTYQRSWPFSDGLGASLLRNGGWGAEVDEEGEVVEEAPLRPTTHLPYGYYEW